MKKLGKKVSFLTKIMLVVGLLISNLSSLSIVFAYEVSDDLVIALNNNKLEISYTEQVAEEVEKVDVKVYEKYSYSEDLFEDEVVTKISLDEEQILALKEGSLELVHSSIFDNGEVVANYELFDGTYSVKVEIIDMTIYEEVTEPENEDEETGSVALVDEGNGNGEPEEFVGTVIASNSYEKEMLHKSGLNIKLFNADTDEEISLVDGKYPVVVDSPKVKVVAQILPGGLRPDDMFKVGEEELRATELITKLFTKDADFAGHLFGEHKIDLEVKVLKQLPVIEDDNIADANEATLVIGEVEEEIVDTHEEIVYTDNINVMYESYIDNAMVLNKVVEDLELDKVYLFYNEDTTGSLYIMSSFEEEVVLTADENVVTKTMLDLYKILVEALGEDTEESLITYSLIKNGVNVLESYDELSEISLEDYLASIEIDETVSITLSCGDLDITYNVVKLADFDNDNLVTEEDLVELINQAIGKNEITDMDKSDVYKLDGKVDTLDVLYLDKVIDNKNWEVMLKSSQVTLNSKLNVLFNEEELSEENYLVSGDKFTVDYILSLADYDVNGIAGLFDYDKSVFEMLSLNINYDWLGNNHDGKFLYLGGEVLTKPEIEDILPEEEIPSEDLETTSLEDEEEPEIVTNDYVLVSLTFKALKATDNSVITLKNIELFNIEEEGTTYYVLDNNTVSTESIKVKASDDNTLSYLSVASVEIDLVDGVYDYEVTVDNTVTTVDVKYILNNIAASVTSIVYPEELVEGDNSVVVTVVSESGISQDYSINVIREKAPEPTTQVNNNTYYENNYDDDKEEEIVVTPGTPDEDEDKKEGKDGTLSRVIIIILILIVIGGLVYLIFKDDDDDETKKANKAINKLKKESIAPEVKEVVKSTIKTVATTKTVSKSNSKVNNSKSKGSKNKNKER